MKILPFPVKKHKNWFYLFWGFFLEAKSTQLIIRVGFVPWLDTWPIGFQQVSSRIAEISKTSGQTSHFLRSNFFSACKFFNFPKNLSLLILITESTSKQNHTETKYFSNRTSNWILCCQDRETNQLGTWQMQWNLVKYSKISLAMYKKPTSKDPRWYIQIPRHLTSLYLCTR